MLITKECTEEQKNAKSCTVREYDFKNKNLGIATAEVHGRYPEEGSAMNTQCDEIYFVLEGAAELIIEDKTFFLEKDDAVLIAKNKKYHVIGKKLKIAICNAPAWNLKQYKLINDR